MMRHIFLRIVNYQAISGILMRLFNTIHTWLICSCPVQVKLQVSLQHSTSSGEWSGCAFGGKMAAERCVSSASGHARIASSSTSAARYARSATAAIRGVWPIPSLRMKSESQRLVSKHWHRYSCGQLEYSINGKVATEPFHHHANSHNTTKISFYCGRIIQPLRLSH